MSSEDERVAWLREQIEGDRAAAVAATPGPWEFEGDDPTDDEVFTVYSGEDGDLIGHTVAWTRGYDRQVPNGQHIARHDPQDVIADCAAKLTLLAEHVPYLCLNPEGMRCNICASREAYPSGVAVHEAFPCKTVIALSRAYRHREGWRQRWGIEAKAARLSASP